MRRPRMSCVVVLLVAVALSLSMTSCGGGGGGGTSDLVLLGFNLPNLAGIPLNNPLIFTFSAPIDPLSITPDTLRVVGLIGPFFEKTVVDGNIVARLPTIPNFADYSDAGYAPGTTYTVSMPVFPAPSTIETPTGKPLLFAESFTFVTLPSPVFIEHRRPIQHGTPPSLGGRSDDEGCLQNSSNALFVPPGIVQTGSGPGATLLCLANEGAPRVIEAECTPRHDERAVGTPSAVFPGRVDLPAIRMRLNEPLDPLTVVPYVSANQLPVNMQLLRVAQKDETPIVPPEEIKTNQPLIVQTLDQVEIILVASGAVEQGIYCINLTPNIRDLAQNQLRFDDDPLPTAGGYQAFDPNVALPGWRLYFRTLELPATALAINESYSNNNREWGDNLSLSAEPGLYTVSDDTLPGFTDTLLGPVSGVNSGGSTAAIPNMSLIFNSTQCGQTTTANWNNGAGTGYRMLNITTLAANSDVTSGADELKAVWKPWCGAAEDISLDSRVLNNFAVNTSPGPGASVDNDGIYEVQEIYIDAGDTMTVSGSKPLLVICRGDCTILGTINANGQAGGHGFDTDGSTVYTDPSAAAAGGVGGVGGPGGGAGGAGNNPVLGANGGNGFSGVLPTVVHASSGALFTGVLTAPPGGFSSTDTVGGGGGGHSIVGGLGTDDDASHVNASQAGAFGTPLFTKPIAEFLPDRGYLPFSNVTGGSGAGGGGARDANASGTVENGDHGGAGGGGAGGGIWFIVCGNVTIGSSAVINCNGGDGGSTFAIADQLINPGPDGNVGGGDDFLQGENPVASPSGLGGPGGGGAGGGICIVGRGTFNVAAGATLTAMGGAGGMGAGSASGGQGGDGRIVLATFGSSASDPTMLGNATPAASTGTRWNPPHGLVGGHHTSVGQTTWIDLFTPTAVFNPGGTNPPAVVDNFAFLQGAPFNLSQGVGGADDFDAILEFQGADDLAPLPGGAAAPALAQGLTAWVTDITLINGKRYIRWRYRFRVADTYPGFGPGGAPMPAVLDITIPYTN